MTAIGVVVCGILPVLLTGALAVQMQPDLDFTASGVGLGTAAFFATGAVTSVLLGRLVDVLGSRRGLRVAALCAAASLLGIGLFAGSLMHLVALLGLGGIANALAHPAANRTLLRNVSGRQGLVFGMKQAAIPMGSLLGGMSVPLVALTVGWRWAFVGAGLLALVMAVGVPRSTHAIARSRSGSDDTGKGAVRPLRPLVLIAVAAGCGALASNSVAAFLTLSNVDAGLSEGAAGLLLSASSLGGLLVRVGAGWGADKHQGIRRFGVPVLLVLGGVGMLALTIPTPAALIAGSLLSFAAGWGWPGLFNLMLSRARPDAPAAATGIGLTGVYLGAALGPLGFGALADTYSFEIAWIAAAATTLLGAGMMLGGTRLLEAAPRSRTDA